MGRKIAFRRWAAAMLAASVFLAACATTSNVPLVPTVKSSPTAPPTEPSRPVETPVPSATPTLSPDEQPPAGAQREFSTDFSKHIVAYSEILSGGPPKDGIPAIDRPRFEMVTDADAWLKPVERVIFFQLGGDARAYPIQILMWHEIVNDTVDGVPIVITFCPLCTRRSLSSERSTGSRLHSARPAGCASAT